MTHLITDAFYKEKLYQLSITTFSQADTQFAKDKSKIKELSKRELTQEVLESSLGNFGKTSQGPHYSYLSFVCTNENLYSIARQGLQNFRHLQHIDVSHNNILSLKPLNGLKFVVTINCSFNKLTKLLDFKNAPLQLMFVDSSNNEIETMHDMSAHRFLKTLNLSNNRISDIGGVQSNKYLQILNLSYNQIEYIQNLDDMNLVELNVAGNIITQVQGLTKLPMLRKLDISQNQVSRLEGLIELIQLREMKISDNNLRRVRELSYLENLVYLSILDLSSNPIQERRYYRMQILYRLPGLRILDSVNVTPEDIVKAENLYGMDLEDRQRNFKDVLPEEDFIDRRIHVSDMIDPETDSENEDQEFVDQYDKQGVLLDKKFRTLEKNNSLSDMYHTGKSLQDRPEYMTMKSVKSQY